MAALLPFVLSGLFPLSQPRADLYPLFLTEAVDTASCVWSCAQLVLSEKRFRGLVAYRGSSVLTDAWEMCVLPRLTKAMTAHSGCC